MIRFTATITTLALLVSASTEAQKMVITRAGSRAVRPGPEANFTGEVRVEITRAQITEALTHLGFYAGWAKATKAMTAVTRTLGK